MVGKLHSKSRSLCAPVGQAVTRRSALALPTGLLSPCLRNRSTPPALFRGCYPSAPRQAPQSPAHFEALECRSLPVSFTPIFHFGSIDCRGAVFTSLSSSGLGLLGSSTG